MVVDHGVEVTENSSTNYGLNFAPGGRVTYDIATFGAPQDSPLAIGATIIGSKKADMVNAHRHRSATSCCRPAAPTPSSATRATITCPVCPATTRSTAARASISCVAATDDDILQVRGDEGTFDVFDGGAGNDTLQFLGNGVVTLGGLRRDGFLDRKAAGQRARAASAPARWTCSTSAG